MNENREQVIANDNDIKRQVSGITTNAEKGMKPSQNMNEELFYRSINR